jgi:hypothetical protein
MRVTHGFVEPNTVTEAQNHRPSEEIFEQNWTKVKNVLKVKTLHFFFMVGLNSPQIDYMAASVCVLSRKGCKS